MKIKRLIATGLAAAAVLFLGTANADLIVNPGGTGSTGEVVQFGDAGPAFVISTQTNQNNTVIFQSIEQLITTAGGQCCLNAADGTLNYVEWYLADALQGFSRLIFNLQGPGGNPASTPDTSVNITLWDQDDVSTPFGPYDVMGSGQNFFEALGTDGDFITRIRLTSDLGFLMRDLQQVRIAAADLPCPPGSDNEFPPCNDDEPPVDVPEPGTLGLLGLGLLGLAARRRIKV